MSQAPVNRIIAVSFVDGPGARCAIFLQGCNLACAYCHNPETQALCNGCGQCVALCPAQALTVAGQEVLWNRARCEECDRCIAACPRNASPKVRSMTAAEVFSEVERVYPLVRGITVSGGECSLHPAFLTDLFTRAKGRGLSCLMDSNGMTDFAAQPDLMAVCDGVMLDVKAWDSEVHRRLTGADNAAVKQNLRFLAESGKLCEVRIVCLEPEVDVSATIDGIAACLGGRVAATTLKLIRFRPFGVKGALAARPSPTDDRMEVYAARAARAGFGRIVIT